MLEKSDTKYRQFKPERRSILIDFINDTTSGK